MSTIKKFAWIDTLRVFASLTVILDHYLRCFYPSHEFGSLMLSFMELGTTLGVFIFFAMSGYLVPASLERVANIWEFYRRKLVRVVTPYTVSYLMLSILFIAFGLFNMEVAGRTPLFHALYGDCNAIEVLTGIFPLELNFLRYFNIPNKLFIGEWFMGVIVVLFILAPLVYKTMIRQPVVALIIWTAIAVAVFYPAKELADEGRIILGFWIPIVRVPEFLFGMILFTYKDFFKLHRKKLLILSELVIIIVGAIFIQCRTEIESPIERIYPLHPISFILSFPTIYLLFNLIEDLNKLLPKIFEWINGFSDISYIALLIQHVIIYVLADQFKYEFFSNFGIFFMFFVNVFVIIQLSKYIKKFSDPIEKYLKPARKNIQN